MCYTYKLALPCQYSYILAKLNHKYYSNSLCQQGFHLQPRLMDKQDELISKYEIFSKFLHNLLISDLCVSPDLCVYI